MASRYQWTRMTREDASQTLDRLGALRDSVMFSRDTTEISWCPLPFYRNYRLYRFINYATMPVFNQYYLSNGVEFFALDGSAGPIYKVNQKDPLSLQESLVLSYLEFFFGNVQGSEGDVHLIERIEKSKMFETLPSRQRAGVIGLFKPLQIASDKIRGGFKVNGTIYYGGSLLAVQLDVAPDGRLTFREQTPLMSGLNIPAEAYQKKWLEA